MSECVVLVRRFIKPERAKEFEAKFLGLPAVTAPGFLGKTLTRLDALGLPPGLNSMHIAGNPDCVTYVIVERWASVDQFRAYVPSASTSDQDEFEALPRQRAILSVV
ncbi:hypothetical protein GCM10023144_45040 [Pigmentiphaga soli]|uniref:ABM domain-containing protein n=1 Tax=Pigmentiphaga soli TaxID=1007095 RepID=A0ABP8HQP9_9BURK